MVFACTHAIAEILHQVYNDQLPRLDLRIQPAQSVNTPSEFREPSTLPFCECFLLHSNPLLLLCERHLRQKLIMRRLYGL